MEQLINQELAAKLESSEFCHIIDETVERFVAVLNVISRLFESVIDSETFVPPVIVVIQHVVKNIAGQIRHLSPLDQHDKHLQYVGCLSFEPIPWSRNVCDT